MLVRISIKIRTQLQLQIWGEIFLFYVITFSSFDDFREDFAKICFETLLQYSLLENCKSNSNSTTSSINGSLDSQTTKMLQLNINDDEEDCKVTNKLAVTSLLHRFQEVLCKYIEDEKLSSPVPLPSHRVTELSFVLKALTTLISSLKTGQSQGEVDQRTWHQIIGLYPHLVQATSLQSSSVSQCLQAVLLQYHDLLQPPSAACVNNKN